jgi:ligand-binding sensor domain-containing protein
MKSRTCILLALLALAANIVSAQVYRNFTTTDGLPDNNVPGVAIDKNNIKWFATQSGVAKYNDTIFTVYTKNEGLADNYINCIAVDHANHIWAGTSFGVSMFNGTTWTTYTTTSGLVDNMINYICGDAAGNVWIGTNSGLSKFDGTTWTTYTTAEGLPSNSVSYLVPDSQGNLWIGTWLGGMAKYNGTSFTVFTTNDSLVDNNLYTIGIDGSGNIYAGTHSGISVFSSAGTWVKNIRKSDGLFNNFVQDIAFDSRGTMWAGIYADYIQDGAVTRNHGSNWMNLTVSGGLVYKQVLRVAADKQDYLWVTTGNGVSRITDENSGISTVTSDAVKLYPNPARETANIEVPSEGRLVLTSTSGTRILDRTIASGTTQVDVSSLQPGIYFMYFISGSSSFARKLVVN